MTGTTIILPESKRGMCIKRELSTVAIEIRCPDDAYAEALRDQIISAWLDQHRIVLARAVE